MLITMMSKNGHNALIGVEYHAHGDDWCELKLPYNAQLASDATTGIMASGPILTMMDMVTSMSIWLRAGKFQPQATLDLRVDYLRPATPGNTIIGHGECYALTRSIAFIRGFAHDGDPDRPLAHVAGTYMFTAGA
ncbi:MAG: PaaI family thioesterase [Chakrabartia sp.]